MDETIEFLKKVPFFSGLDEGHLTWLCDRVVEVQLSPGQDLFVQGSQADKAYVIMSGDLEILQTSGGREVLLRVASPGEVIGEQALLEERPRTATIRARTPSRLLAIPGELFNQLLGTSPNAARDMLHTVTARLRSTENMLRQSEKMAQVGTLTAGIAHELNNPAAAARRGAEQLRETFAKVQQAQMRLVSLQVSGEQMAILRGLDTLAQDRAVHPLELEALDRSDREADLESWLDEQAVEEPWVLSPVLVNLGYDRDGLSVLNGQFDRAQLPAVIGWLSETFSVYSLLFEIGEGATRISDIVRSLKAYSYLDQAPVQAVNVHEGLDNTLVILRSKLKTGVTVHKEYAADLPAIQAYGSELNQVWTNLIDNAIDALEGHGELTLRTRREGDWVAVEVEDNGPGIPQEVQPKIFDAFFTTKEPGKGTGLGLNISYKIVVERHRGDLRVFSRPGLTRFTARLPLNFERVQAEAPAVSAIERVGDEQLRQILETSKSVAVVGISNRDDRPANSVPGYLQRHGYHIIPVNPNLEEVHGEKAYPDLKSIPEPVDVVEVFRPPEEAPEIVDQAIQIGAKTVWMQQGIVNESAAAVARAAGLNVVMDACMRTEHRRLIGG